MRTAIEAINDRIAVEQKRLHARLRKRQARAQNHSDSSRGHRRRHSLAHTDCCADNAFPFAIHHRPSMQERKTMKLLKARKGPRQRTGLRRRRQ